ncbi:cytochrome P450 CYP72A219-like protein [Tanacetum coccineum]
MNKQGTKLSKLDRFLISKEVISLLPDIRITALDRMWSDHIPILLHCSKRDCGSVPFKIFHSWFSREGFDEVINTELSLLGHHDGSSNMLFHEKLKVLKQKIKHWHTSTRSNEASKRLEVLKNLKILNDKIEDGSASNDDRESRINLLHEVDKLDNLKAMDSIKKSRLKCDIEGDENSKFFHSLINQKRRANDSLIDLPSTPYLYRLNECDRALLETNVSIDEIKDVVWDCGSDKAPGPDGFTFAFVKRYWDLLKSDIHVFVASFLASKKMLPDSNSEWIKACLESSRTSILINGSPTSEFNVRRGLRQGDPLSPFLFIIIMEAITTTEWSIHDMENIIRIFQIFHLASGLKINIHKSNIYGIGVSEEDVHLMASNTGCSAGLFPFTYLGLPIGSNMSLTANWKTLVDKFHSKLSSWKNNLLSFGERFTLIKAVLGSLGIYYLSFFKVPEAILKTLEKSRVSFFWGSSQGSKKLTWMKWTKILTSYDKGGLDIGSSNLLISPYFTNGDGVFIPVQIHYGRKLLEHCMIVMVGSITIGVNSQDIWHGNSPLYTHFNRLFRLDQEKNCRIVDRIVDGQWSWNWSCNTLGVRNTAYLNNLLLKISELDINKAKDKCVWSLAHDGVFSVAALRRRIDDHILPSLDIKTTWDKTLPYKVNIFMWRLKLDRLPHRLNLSSRGIEIPEISCPSCSGNVESNQHIFFGCDFAKEVWKIIRRWCEEAFPLFDSNAYWIDWLDSWYKFMFGDLKELVQMSNEAKSKPMSLNHDIANRVLPFYYNALSTHGKTCFTWLGIKPVVQLSEPAMIREVLNNYNQYQKPRGGNPLTKLLARGVADAEADQWVKHRKIINPTFHVEKLKHMVPAFYVSCSEMLNKWGETLNKESSGEVDVWTYLSTFSADVISRTAFGSSYDEGRKIFELQREQAVLVVKAAQSVYIPGLRFLPTKSNNRMKEIDREIKASIKNIIDKRVVAMKAGETSNDDLLGILLDSNYKEIKQHGSKYGLSIEDVIEECKLFYFAGQETTGTMLVWTMILLGHHTDWQKRAREEVLHVFGDKKPDIDGLSHLKVINIIFHEVLRLYPPALLLRRMIHEETKLGNLTLPAGTLLQLNILLSHHDKDTWGEDVHEFNPERFSEGVSKATKGQATYLPFGGGPRICIGQNFAMLEAKMALAMILQRFSFEVSPSYTHAPHSKFTLQPQFGAHLVLHKL